MNALELYTEFVNLIFIIYLLVAAINTECFSSLQWSFVFLILVFTYFMRYVSKKGKGYKQQ